MMQHGFVNVRHFSRERNGDQIGEGIFGKFADLSGQAERCAPLTVAMRRISAGETVLSAAASCAHFLEQVEFGLLLSGFADGGKAVGAEAEIDAGVGELLARKRRMAEIIMAARAVNDVDLCLAKQFGVAARQAD